MCQIEDDLLNLKFLTQVSRIEELFAGRVNNQDIVRFAFALYFNRQSSYRFKVSPLTFFKKHERMRRGFVRGGGVRNQESRTVPRGGDRQASLGVGQLE